MSPSDATLITLLRDPSSLSYAVLGTGAVGGFYGARLQRAGAVVHFLLHHDYEHVRTHGLRVDSIAGDFHLPEVNAYCDPQDLPPCDVTIVALKTTQNELLANWLPKLVRPGSIVLILQNGLGVEAKVAQTLSGLGKSGLGKPTLVSHSFAAPQAEHPVAILGGLCFVCAHKVGPGHIHHLDYGAIKLGQYAADNQPCGITKPMQQVAADFERSGIPITLAEDLLLVRWQKLVWNIPFNGLSVVLDARTDQIMADCAARTLVEQLMAEVVAGAKACGRSISPDFVQLMLDQTETMVPYHTSMKIDYDLGRPLEIEAMFGEPLRSAQAAGVVLPKIAMLYQQLKFLDRQRSRTTPSQIGDDAVDSSTTPGGIHPD